MSDHVDMRSPSDTSLLFFCRPSEYVWPWHPVRNSKVARGRPGTESTQSEDGYKMKRRRAGSHNICSPESLCQGTGFPQAVGGRAKRKSWRNFDGSKVFVFNVLYVPSWGGPVLGDSVNPQFVTSVLSHFGTARCQIVQVRRTGPFGQGRASKIAGDP